MYPRLLTPALLALSVAACATPQPQVEPQPEPQAMQGGCNAEPVQHLVGKSVDSDSMEAARKAAGAGVVRTLRPDQVVTMEYRIDRLNLYIDDSGTITRIACG